MKLNMVGIVALFLFVMPVGSRAQTSSTTSAAKDAEKNPPEPAIPESVPYGFWFKKLGVALDNEAKGPDPELIARMVETKDETELNQVDAVAILHTTGLSKVDQAVVKGEVLTWWQNYKQLEATQNATVVAGEMTDDKRVAFNKAKADLTMTTVQRLQTTLSPTGAANFKTFIHLQCEAHYSIEECEVLIAKMRYDKKHNPSAFLPAWPPNLDRLDELLGKVEKGEAKDSEKEEFRRLAEKTLREWQPQYSPGYMKRIESALNPQP